MQKMAIRPLALSRSSLVFIWIIRWLIYSNDDKSENGTDRTSGRNNERYVFSDSGTYVEQACLK